MSSITVKDSQALVLDAGHIAVESNLADKDQLKEVQSKRGRQYNDEDYKQLETLMYDRFSLQLEAAQVRHHLHEGLPTDDLAADGSYGGSLYGGHRGP